MKYYAPNTEFDKFMRYYSSLVLKSFAFQKKFSQS